METLIEADEIKEILISVFAISLAFALVFAGLDGMFGYPAEFFIFIIISGITIGSGFVLHEMGHKLIAIYYGAHAKFKMWTKGLIFMLIVSVMGMLFAAPGAVYIYARNITRRENGLISVAGPTVNLILMVFFLVMAVVYPKTLYFSFLHGINILGIENGGIHVWFFGAGINLILALFNMIPAFPLDGSKVLMWSKPAWFLLTFGMLFVGSVPLPALGVSLLPLGFVIMWGILFLLAVVVSRLVFR